MHASVYYLTVVIILDCIHLSQNVWYYTADTVWVCYVNVSMIDYLC